MRHGHRILTSAILLFLGTGLAVLHAQAVQGSRRVEVVDARGIIDGSLERAIVSNLRLAEREGAEALVIQIDSGGGIEGERAERLVNEVLAARIPVITWIGPPGARAEHSAAVLAMAGHVTAMAPGTSLGAAKTLDLRARDEQPERTATLLRTVALERGLQPDAIFNVFLGPLSAHDAEERGLVDVLAVQLRDLLNRVDGLEVVVAGDTRTIDTDEVNIRLHKPDLGGRILHAVMQPSIAYLLLLVGLVGLVFEIFHPSTGPAGVTGALGVALGLYGVATLHGSWLGVALIVAGVAGFSVDLRFQSLGVFTLLGFAGLVGGSLLLFGGPWLGVNPWMLALGIIGMVLFLLGAMTRVLRDLRAVASGELEVRDAHPHPE